ncbi:LOW QUALITY PROTEIN: IQ motif and SEC7 domain-containing protein 1 [Plecturocebus cupreus]
MNKSFEWIVLCNMRVQFSLEGPEKLHSSYFEGKQVSVTNDGSQSVCGDLNELTTLKSPAPSKDFMEAITELEDVFSRQVKSLAESIDDALHCRSLHTEEARALDAVRAWDAEPQTALHNTDHLKLDEMMASYSNVTLYIDEEELSSPLPLSQAGDRPSSTESDPWLQAGGTAPDCWGLGHKEDKANMDTSCSGCGDSSVDLSDRSERDSLKRQSAYERSLGGRQESPKCGPHSGSPKSLPQEEPELQPRPPRPLATWPSTARPTGTASLSLTTQKASMTASTAHPTLMTPSAAAPSGGPKTACGNRRSASRPSRRRPATARTHPPSAATRHCRSGLNLINKKPEKGAQYLIEGDFVPNKPVGLAHLLMQCKGLSKQMIRDSLGNRLKQFKRKVFNCVVDETDFSVMELRKFH